MCRTIRLPLPNRLIGLVVRRLPRERKILGTNPVCAEIFPGSSHTNDFKIGTPVATLPVAWRYRVSARTGQPGVSMLWLGDTETSISVWQHVKLSEQIRPWDTLACCWDVKQPTNKNNPSDLPWAQQGFLSLWYNNMPVGGHKTPAHRARLLLSAVQDSSISSTRCLSAIQTAWLA